MPTHTHTSDMFQGCPSVRFLGRPPFLGSSRVAALPPRCTLTIHSHTNATIKQSPIHHLVLVPQEIFPDLSKSSLGVFPYAPLAPSASSIRGSASHTRAGLAVHYTHSQHSGWFTGLTNGRAESGPTQK